VGTHHTRAKLGRFFDHGIRRTSIRVRSTVLTARETLLGCEAVNSTIVEKTHFQLSSLGLACQRAADQTTEQHGRIRNTGSRI
jgi:hypothetical protein